MTTDSFSSPTHQSGSLDPAPWTYGRVVATMASAKGARPSVALREVIGCPSARAVNMVRRGRIPPEYWATVLKALAAMGVAVPADVLQQAELQYQAARKASKIQPSLDLKGVAE